MQDCICAAQLWTAAVFFLLYCIVLHLFMFIYFVLLSLVSWWADKLGIANAILYQDIFLTYTCSCLIVIVDIDECVTETPCLYNGTCTNTNGSYTCDCIGTGYEGANCETGETK